MRVLLDTNVLVYDTVEDSDYHGEAARIVDEAREIYVPSIVVHEYIWVMLKTVQAPSTFVSRKIREYVEDPRVVYILEPPEILAYALKILEEDKASAKEINDYIILATALHYNLVLATFDKELKSRAAKRGLKVVP